VEPELPLRRNRDFMALWVGQTTSALGTSISSLAYPLLLLAVTGSPALAGAGATVLAATTFLLRIPAGVVADRVDRKRLMLVCDGGRLLAVGSLGLAAAFGEVHLAHVFLVAVVEGALGVLFAPAETVAVRAVVAPTQVRDAVARNQARQQLASLVGPSLGGALFGLGRGLPFLADALSYAVSFLAVAIVRTPLPQGRPSPPGRRLRQELSEGLRWLCHQRFLRYFVVWLAGAGMLFTSLGLVTLVIAHELGATPAQIGLTFTITGAGGLAGALAAPALLRRASPAVIVISYAWIATAATFALLLVDSVWVLGLIGAAAFFPVPTLNALVMSEVAQRAPEAILGRANSATVQLLTLFHPLSPVLAGLALEILGTPATLVSYGVALAVLAVLVTTSPTVRAGPPD
jgi:predicted MFS family arabinose efflux permease